MQLTTNQSTVRSHLKNAACVSVNNSAVDIVPKIAPRNQPKTQPHAQLRIQPGILPNHLIANSSALHGSQEFIKNLRLMEAQPRIQPSMWPSTQTRLQPCGQSSIQLAKSSAVYLAKTASKNFTNWSRQAEYSNKLTI